MGDGFSALSLTQESVLECFCLICVNPPFEKNTQGLITGLNVLSLYLYSTKVLLFTGHMG